MWDWIITLAVLLSLTLAIWAKVSRQTIPQLLGDLKERLIDKKEDITEDMGVEIYE